jgi:hypothetical protein
MGCKSRHFNRDDAATKYAILPTVNATASHYLFKLGERNLPICVIDDSEDRLRPGRRELLTEVVLDAVAPWKLIIDKLPGFRDAGKPVDFQVRLDLSCRDRLYRALRAAIMPSLPEFITADEAKRQSEGPPTPENVIIVVVAGKSPWSKALFGHDRSFAISAERTIAMLARDEVKSIRSKTDEVPYFTRVLTHELGHVLGLADLYAFDGVDGNSTIPGQNRSIMSYATTSVSTDEFHGLRAIQHAMTNNLTTPVCLPPYEQVSVHQSDGATEGAKLSLICALPPDESGARGGFQLLGDSTWTSHKPDHPAPTQPQWDAADILRASVGKTFRCPYGPSDEQTVDILVVQNPSNEAPFLKVTAKTVRGNVMIKEFPVTQKNPEFSMWHQKEGEVATDGAFTGELLAFPKEKGTSLALLVTKLSSIWRRGPSDTHGRVNQNYSNTLFECQEAL